MAARPESATETSSVPASAGPCEGKSGPQGPTLSRDPGVQNASSAFRLGWSLHSSRGSACGMQAAEAKAGSHSESVSYGHITRLSCDAGVCDRGELAKDGVLGLGPKPPQSESGVERRPEVSTPYLVNPSGDVSSPRRIATDADDAISYGGSSTDDSLNSDLELDSRMANGEQLTYMTIGNGCSGDWTVSCKGFQGAPFVHSVCIPFGPVTDGPHTVSVCTRHPLGCEGSQSSSPDANGCLCGWTAVG